MITTNRGILMSNIWGAFDFKDTPYSTEPLKTNEEDFKLFTGRNKEVALFLTQMDRKNGSIVLISGDAGIGKTSFFNVQQYRITATQTNITSKLLPCYVPTNFLKSDDERILAKRLMHNTLDSIELFCGKNKKDLPTEIKTIKNWISHRPDTSGRGVQIGPVGGSYSFEFPPVDQASLENWRNIFGIVTDECIKNLKVDGLIACLDNAEEISLENLTRFLMAFRDTLFSINHIWWVIIGQPNLYSQLVAEDNRISERVRGPAIEIPPMTNSEIHELVERRIKRYRKDDKALSPLSEDIHKHLYNASRGVARFVLDAADNLVNAITSEVIENVISEDFAARGNIAESINNALKSLLFDHRIPDDDAKEKLGAMSAQMLADMLKQMHITDRDIKILEKIGFSEVSAENYADFEIDSVANFQSFFLERLTSKNLLQRCFVNGENHYRLKNYAYLCADLEVFDNII